MRKFYLISLATCLLLSNTVYGQTSLSFYHLGDATFQNTNLNPAYAPDARLMIGLPVISGIHLHANNKLSYNQIITKEGNNNVVNISSIINELQNQNMLSAHANVSLFHLGYRFPNGTMMSLFANERIEIHIGHQEIAPEDIGFGANQIELGAQGLINAPREQGRLAFVIRFVVKVAIALKAFAGDAADFGHAHHRRDRSLGSERLHSSRSLRALGAARPSRRSPSARAHQSAPPSAPLSTRPSRARQREARSRSRGAQEHH